MDLLKGLVMVIMVLDHVRDYFHSGAFLFDPTDPEQSTLPVFFTRWITDFCAPAFSFLAGLSAFIVGKRKTTTELSGFLLKRGLWLILVEVTIVTFGWHFDFQFRNFVLQTIWSLGISMIVLAGLIHLRKTVVLTFSCVLIFGHNLLDTIHFEGNVLWSFLHERNRFAFAGEHYFVTAYPLLPWLAVMLLGYCVGPLYDSSFEPARRVRILNGVGILACVFVVVLIVTNGYGDPVKWARYATAAGTIISVFNMTKYPPSLLFLLVTLGATFLFLANSEKWKGKVVVFFALLEEFHFSSMFFIFILFIFSP